jgi:predicted DNA-binding protein (MmcQ/YjbR family)
LAETFPFGAKTSVFKVAGKMFALSQLAEHLRATYSAVIPGYHLRSVSNSPRRSG